MEFFDQVTQDAAEQLNKLEKEKDGLKKELIELKVGKCFFCKPETKI